MKIVAINKNSSKLNDWSVEKPNAPYPSRCGALEINKIINREKLMKG
jgi:hypothetical protein